MLPWRQAAAESAKGGAESIARMAAMEQVVEQLRLLTARNEAT